MRAEGGALGALDWARGDHLDGVAVRFMMTMYALDRPGDPSRALRQR
jgi:hypothetical protein